MIKVPSALTLSEITRCLTDIWDTISWMDKGPTANLDLRGRRVSNAGRSVHVGDYVTRAELDELERRVKALE